MSNINPSHYTAHNVTPIDLIGAYDLNFNCGNVVKYVARAREKHGREDLIKALWYLLNELGIDKRKITEVTKQIEDGSFDHFDEDLPSFLREAK